MIHNVLGIGGSHWVVTQARIQPCGTGQRAVVPAALALVFHVIKDHITVHRGACARAIEPPDFVEAFVCSSKHLVKLRLVDVLKNVLPQVAIERLDRAVIHVELVNAHPKRHARSQNCCVLAGNRDVVPQQLRAPDIGWAQVLKRVQRRICPRQYLLASLQGRDDLGPVRQADAARLVGCSRGPLGHGFLIGPAHQHGVLRGRANVIGSKGKDKPACVGHQNGVLDDWAI